MIIVDQFMNENYELSYNYNINYMNEQCEMLMESGAFSAVLKKIKNGIKILLGYIRKVAKTVKEALDNFFTKLNKTIFKNSNIIIKGWDIDINFSIKGYCDSLDKVFNVSKSASEEIDNSINFFLSSKGNKDSLENFNTINKLLNDRYNELIKDKLITNYDFSDFDNVVVKNENAVPIKRKDLFKFLKKIVNECKPLISKHDNFYNCINTTVKKLDELVSELESKINLLPDKEAKFKVSAAASLFRIVNTRLVNYFNLGSKRLNDLGKSLGEKITNPIINEVLKNK